MVGETAERSPHPRSVIRYAWFSAAAWTGVIVVLAGVLVFDLHRETLERSAERARIVLATDALYRSWVAGHGGVYVKEDEGTPPNPYLDSTVSQIELRDGRHLVLMNPAYMTRQIAELRGRTGGVQSRLVSLNPLNPNNAPDPWERAALESFVEGPGSQAVATVVENDDGAKTLHMLRPLYTEEGCLQCHSAQGYKLGELRGGLVVMMPVTPFFIAVREALSVELVVLFLVWLLGLGALVLFVGLVRRQGEERERAAERTAISEQRLSLALEGGGTGLWDWNIRTGERTVNKQWAQMLGYSPEEVGKDLDRWEEMLHPEDSARVLQGLEDHLEGASSEHRQTYRLRHKQGHWVWILDSGKIVERAEDGSPLRATGTHVDVTQIKLMEERLRAYGQQRHAIARLAELALKGAGDSEVFDAGCRELSDALGTPLCGVWVFEEAGGSQLQMVAGCGWKGEMGPRAAFPYDPRLPPGLALESQETLVIEDIRDDERIDNCALLAEHGVVSGIISACVYQGRRLGAIGCFTTTQRTFSREEMHFLEAVARMLTLAVTGSRIRRENERLARTLAQAHDVIVISDREGRLVYVNPAFERLTGYTSEEVLGQNSRFLKSGQNDPGIYREMWDVLVTGGTWRGTLINRRKDGTIYHERATINPLYEGGHEITGFFKVGRDVSREIEMENQLRQAQKLESIGQLAAGIAHEINTPTQYVSDNTRFLDDAFNDVTTLLQTLEEECGDDANGSLPERMARVRRALEEADVEYLLEEVPKAINQSLEGLARVSKIVLAMKEFSHPGSDDKQAVDLNKAIENTVTVARSEWKYVAEMKLDLDPKLPLVDCYAGELNQVVLNMVINAAHAIGDRIGKGSDQMGQITIRTRQEDDQAVIEIGDTGCGIPPEHLDQVFEPFFTTKEVGRGTGQGLAIAHNVIVNKHGGRVDLRSQVGEGTTFIIRLPVKAVVKSPVVS